MFVGDEVALDVSAILHRVAAGHPDLTRQIIDGRDVVAPAPEQRGRLSYAPALGGPASAPARPGALRQRATASLTCSDPPRST